MGVSVITFVGDRHASRVGLSLLSAAGLTNFIADSRQSYINIVKKQAEDIKQPADLREGLRNIIQNSILCDAQSFAMKMEKVYRDIWRQYCLTD